MFVSVYANENERLIAKLFLEILLKKDGDMIRGDFLDGLDARIRLTRSYTLDS